MSYETLKVERHGPVGWLIFNRPEQLNAMNARMREELADAWVELDRDPAVRVIVHTGEGRAFQTGVDVEEIATDGIGMERYRRSLEEWDLHFTSWHQGVWKPVVTAVNGICAGGAFHWVADADVVIAASDAEFFDPHVSVGQVVAIEAIGLMRKMPVEAVMRMPVGRHERMSAQRAYELMISEIVDRPSGCGGRPGAGGEDRPQLTRRHGGDQAGAVGALGRADRGAAATPELVPMWATPTRPRARRRSPSGASPGGRRRPRRGSGEGDR